MHIAVEISTFRDLTPLKFTDDRPAIIAGYYW